MTRSIRTLETTPLADVASSGTMTFAYPAGSTASDFTTQGATLAIGDNTYPAPGFFSAKLGDDAVTVTLSGLTAAALTKCRLGLSELASPLDAGLVISHVKAKVVDKTADFTLSSTEKGAYVHVTSAAPVAVSLPNDWRKGDACIVRRVGTGAVTWTALSGSTVLLPAARVGHVGISEQYDEMLLRVQSNADGVSAKWSIQGTTA